jgi:hypothetical protein
MGVHMMRQFTDELSYGQTADELNELVMVKHNVIAKPVSAGQP